MKENALNKLAIALADRLREVFARRPELAGQLLWLLAKGPPVSVGHVAETLSISHHEAIDLLHESPGVELDEDNNVTGCFGLSLTPTPHHFRVGEHELFTWCALDALILPIVLNQLVHVESSCVVTGAKILITVGPDSIQMVEPAGAVMAVIVPKASEVRCKVRSAFCDKVYFFSSSETASIWVNEHEEATILSVNDAFRLGQLLLENIF